MPDDSTSQALAAAQAKEEAAFKERVFDFLDELRESNKINMWGAVEYIEFEFDVSRAEASKLLLKWMRTFSERQAKKGTQDNGNS